MRGYYDSQDRPRGDHPSAQGRQGYGQRGAWGPGRGADGPYGHVHVPLRVGGIEPLQSYRDFVQSQPHDAAGGAQSLVDQYEGYKEAYLRRFRSAFFDAVRTSDWFQDRYGPERRHAELRQSMEQARANAAAFRAAVEEDPRRALRLVSLEPGAPLSTLKQPKASAEEPPPTSAEAQDAAALLFGALPWSRMFCYRNVPVCVDRMALLASLRAVLEPCDVAVHFSDARPSEDGGEGRLALLFRRDVIVEVLGDALDGAELRRRLEEVFVPVEADAKVEEGKKLQADDQHMDMLSKVPECRVPPPAVDAWACRSAFATTGRASANRNASRSFRPSSRQSPKAPAWAWRSRHRS